MHRIELSGGFLGRFLGPLLKNGLTLTGNLLSSLAKSIFIPLGSTAVTAATTAAVIHKKMFGSGNAILIILNEGMNNVMEIVKWLEEFGKRR